MKTLLAIFGILPLVAAGQTGDPTITSRVAALLSSGVSGGTQGLYLKQVGGQALANQQEKLGFDPGTQVATVPFLYLMGLVQNSTLTLDSQIPRFDASSPGNCLGQAGAPEPLRTALTEMMWHSDALRTQELQAYIGGKAKLDTFARNIGMRSTGMPPTPGCQTGVTGQTTLTDATSLFEGVANATLLSTARSAFYSYLPGKGQFTAEGADWNHLWDTDIPNLLRQEAPAGTTADQLKSFQSSMDLAYKAGASVNCQNANCSSVLENLSIAGWAQIPFCTAGPKVNRGYVFGEFIANAPDNAYVPGKKTAAQTAFGAARAELLREQIHDGLASCYASKPVMVDPAPGSVLPNHTVAFTWSPGTGWDGYRLDAGVTLGTTEFGSVLATTPTATITSLRCDGRPVYVRLWTHAAGAYGNPTDYTYNGCPVGGGPQMISPAPGTNLGTTSVKFTWTAVGGADSYRLEVGNRIGGNDIGIASLTADTKTDDAGVTTVTPPATSATIDNIPSDGRQIYVRITAHIAAGFLFSDYAYNNLLSRTPAISSVVNAASLQPSLSPTCLAVINGTNLDGATVTVGGARAVLVGTPSATQITFLIPPTIATGSSNVTVTAGGVASVPFPITLASVSPALYSQYVDVSGAVLTRAVKPGDTVGLLAVGMGPVDSTATPTLPFNVLVGPNKVSATVVSKKATTTGVTQINFIVPSGTPGGFQPVLVTVQGVASNTVQVGFAGPAVSAVLNAASFAQGAKVAPGSLVSVFGSDLADTDAFGVYPSAKLPGGGGGAIAFNGLSAPLFDVVGSQGQINLLVPFEMPTDGSVSVVVTNSFGVSAPYQVAMAPAAPGIFRILDPSNPHRANAAALMANTAWRVLPSSMADALGWPGDCKANNMPVTAICGQPAAGGDAIQIYVTGLGRATPQANPVGQSLHTGDVAPADGSVLYMTVDMPRVTIGGLDAMVQFSGVAPGFAGLYQINVVVPKGAPTGDDVPIRVEIGGASDQATIAIRP